MYQCWNPECPWYAGRGVRLRQAHVTPDQDGRPHCNACGAFVAQAPVNNDNTAKGVAGAAGGALLGYAVGGPPGLLVGILLGALLASAATSRGR